MVNGRQKGNKAENEVCAILHAWWKRLPLAAVKKDKVTALEFRRRFTATTPLAGTWVGAGDILVNPDLKFPYIVECKKIEGWSLDGMLSNDKWPVWEWWRQCREQAYTAKGIPMLFFSRNNHPWLVMLPVQQARIPLAGEGPPVLRFGSIVVFDAANLSALVPVP